MARSPLKIAMLVNDLDELTSTMTTTLMALAIANRGHKLIMMEVGDLALNPALRVVARARELVGSFNYDAFRLSIAQPKREIDLEEVDALVLRTNPARDNRPWAHDEVRTVTMLLADRGVMIVNDPNALARLDSKLMLARFPKSIVPPTIVSRDISDIIAFVECHGDCVLKPLRGTRGRNVFLSRQGHRDNLLQIIDVLTVDGYAVAQAFVEGAENGDVRVVIVDGQPLCVDGEIAAVARVPGESDFRSNVHTGGCAKPANLDIRQLETANLAAEILQELGIFMAGLDMIGHTIIEANVFAPGGLFDAGIFYDVDFVDAVVEAIEGRAHANRC